MRFTWLLRRLVPHTCQVVLLHVHNWHTSVSWHRAGSALSSESERVPRGAGPGPVGATLPGLAPSPGPGARARPYRSGDAESHGGTGEAVQRGVS